MAQPPSLLQCAEAWCAWDEDLAESKAYHLLIPEWALYHRLSVHIGLHAIDLAPATAAAEKSQTFVHLQHVAMTDLMFHLSSMNQQLQELQDAHRHDRRLLGLVVEHLAAHEPHLAQVLGLTMEVRDLRPAAPHGHR